MTQTQVRRQIKKAVDQLPSERLASLADYIAFLNRPTLRQQVEKAEADLKANRGVSWRMVRDDV